MDIAFLITAFATLFVIIDPIGLTPIFVALTTGMSPQQRRQVALRCCLIAVGILLAFGLFGEALLGFVGIGMPAFRISGGVLLFITALDMLFERRQSRRKDQAKEEHIDDPSVFPMAIPLIAGPGSIATIILLTGDQDWMGFVAVTLVMISVIICAFCLFLFAGVIERGLGKRASTSSHAFWGCFLRPYRFNSSLMGCATLASG